MAFCLPLSAPSAGKGTVAHSLLASSPLLFAARCDLMIVGTPAAM